jgi:hypothetical protein
VTEVSNSSFLHILSKKYSVGAQLPTAPAAAGHKTVLGSAEITVKKVKQKRLAIA